VKKHKGRSERNEPATVPPERTEPAEAGPFQRWEWFALSLVTAVAAWLFLANLGDQCLWQDEAQTALIAQTVLTDGVPKGYDGKNHFSQELGREYGRNYLYRWHTWFPFYLLAGFFGLFGTSTLVARLPFALLGLASVPLGYCLARSLWQSRRAAVLAAVLIATCVPFLILSRQCRYYSPCAFFTLLALWAYWGMVHRRRGAGAAFALAAVLLFHCHFPIWAVLLAAVLLHAAALHRDRLAATAGWSFATVLINLPWLIWLLSPPAVGQYPGVKFSFARPFGLAWQYLDQIFRHVFSPVLLVLLAAAGTAAWVRENRFPRLDRNTVSATALLLLFVGVSLGALCVLTPFYFFRYLAPVIPVLCILAARILDAAMRLHWSAGAAGLAAILLLSPMREYLYEITHHYSGPIDGIVAYLNEHASPDDVVAITYGDLPVKFYTGLRVVGGLTGEDLAPALRARWVILRRNIVCEKDFAVRKYLLEHLRPEDFRRIELDCPDLRFNNRETPDEHLYRTPAGVPPVTIFERIAQ